MRAHDGCAWPLECSTTEEPLSSLWFGRRTGTAGAKFHDKRDILIRNHFRIFAMRLVMGRVYAVSPMVERCASPRLS
jgi:hypothetical protein